MNKGAQKILAEIEAEQKRIAALTEKGLQNSYEEIKKKGFPDAEVIKFGYEIGHSPWVELHYQILCLDWDDRLFSPFDTWFDRHLESGYACLPVKIRDAAHQKYRRQSLYLLATVLNSSYGDDAVKEPYKEAARRPAWEDFSSPDASLRENAALCLNAIGSLEDIPALCQVLQKDSCYKCRAYAASPLMHIAFFKEEAKIKTAEEPAAALKEALENESNLYALASIIDTVQFLFSKRYKAAHIRGEDEGDRKTLLEARQKALRFLNKILATERGSLPNDR